MGPRTEYAPGTFSWVDLATTDLVAAQSFYGEVFGWTSDADPGGTPYTLCHLDGDLVCGMATASGAPAWTSYVTVDDAEAVAGRAESIGATTLSSAFDVADYGRTAVLADPQGAVFAVWQPGTRVGAERVNDVGCLCMNELATTDPGAAQSFYGELFGWTFERVDTGPDGPDLFAVMNRGSLNAHISPTDGGESPAWRPYFTVASAEASAARITELGGHVVAGPFPIPDGAIAIALDPLGAQLALFEGEVDP